MKKKKYDPLEHPVDRLIVAMLLAIVLFILPVVLSTCNAK